MPNHVVLMRLRGPDSVDFCARYNSLCCVVFISLLVQVFVIAKNILITFAMVQLHWHKDFDAIAVFMLYQLKPTHGAISHVSPLLYFDLKFVCIGDTCVVDYHSILSVREMDPRKSIAYGKHINRSKYRLLYVMGSPVGISEAAGPRKPMNIGRGDWTLTSRRRYCYNAPDIVYQLYIDCIGYSFYLSNGVFITVVIGLDHVRWWHESVAGVLPWKV